MIFFHDFAFASSVYYILFIKNFLRRVIVIVFLFSQFSDMKIDLYALTKRFQEIIIGWSRIRTVCPGIA